MLFENRKEQKETRSCSVGKDKLRGWGNGAYLKQNNNNNKKNQHKRF